MNNKIYPNIFPIVAMTEKTNAIGLNGDMIYHLKEDLKYYKETTKNNTIVCGRKTYFSFPKRPLPNRKNIVMTRSGEEFKGCLTLKSREEVLEYAANHPEEKIFISGGENVYRQFMDVAAKLYITIIEEDEDIITDTHFPEVDMNVWELESASDYVVSENVPRYRFCIFKRK